MLSVPRQILYNKIMEGGISRWAAMVFEVGKWLIVATVALLLANYFIGTVFIVDGLSMAPTLSTGSILYVDRLAYLTNDPHRGDIVVIRFPGDPSQRRFVKRVIGEPGELITIANGGVFINGKKLAETYLSTSLQTNGSVYNIVQLKTGEYYLMGDNRPGSNDSRYFGSVNRENFIGKARFVLYPVSLAGYIPPTFYPGIFQPPDLAR